MAWKIHVAFQAGLINLRGCACSEGPEGLRFCRAEQLIECAAAEAV